MNSINFYSNFENITIPIQIITLNESYFIYIGTSEFLFDNLTVGVFNKNANQVHVSEIYDEEYSEISKNLAQKLSTRFKCPIYLSFNVSDDLISFKNDIYYQIERDLFEKLKNI